MAGRTRPRVGDRDLATHIERSRRLAAGETLSAVTNDFRRRLEIRSVIVPMRRGMSGSVMRSARQRLRPAPSMAMPGRMPTPTPASASAIRVWWCSIS